MDLSQRRNSFRRSLNESSLSTEYLDRLEVKRKALDDSIHRFIASKEREYKAYEKELRHEVKGSSGHDGQAGGVERTTSPSAVDALLQSGSSKKVHHNTSEVDFGASNGTSDAQDFPGVFTPEYLAALEQPAPESPSRAEITARSPVLRTYSDSAEQTTQRPVNQRASSSGSSVDGRLVSAMKSATEISKPKYKRVSLAVGDSIVKPSDNVPVALDINSTASHSRLRTVNKQSLLDTSSETIGSVDVTTASKTTSPVGRTGSSAAVQALHDQGSAIAASALDTKQTQVSQQQDVGDMFDLEEDELNATYEELPLSSPEDYFSDGERAIQRRDSQQHLNEDTGEPPPDDSVQSEPLVFAEGAAATKQPASPGFRKPSASMDPIYTGRHYREAEDSAEQSSFYGSSYNRSSKGSFTASSLGESFMAKNAEKLMEMRSQHQQQV